MRTTLRFGLSVALVFFLGSCKPPKPPVTGGGEQGDATYVYTFEKSPHANADTQELIKRFLKIADLSNMYRADDGTVYFSSPNDVNTTFEHDPRTGDIRFRRGMSRYLGDFAPNLPPREDAVRKAEEFLKTNALLPKEADEVKLAHVGGLRSASIIDGKRAGPIVDKLVTLTYSRVVDGLPVFGPGSRIVLELGDQGEIVSLVHHWREVSRGSRRQVAAEELNTREEAEALALRQLRAEFGEKASFKILSTSRAYYDANGGILQPVTAFEAAVTVEDRQVKPFNYLGMIPLLKHSPEPLGLTVLDSKAKELIKTMGPNDKPPPPSEKQTAD